MFLFFLFSCFSFFIFVLIVCFSSYHICFACFLFSLFLLSQYLFYLIFRGAFLQGLSRSGRKSGGQRKKRKHFFTGHTSELSTHNNTYFSWDGKRAKAERPVIGFLKGDSEKVERGICLVNNGLFLLSFVGPPTSHPHPSSFFTCSPPPLLCYFFVLFCSGLAIVIYFLLFFSLLFLLGGQRGSERHACSGRQPGPNRRQRNTKEKKKRNTKGCH